LIILGLFCIAEDSNSSNSPTPSNSSNGSLEELDPLANHHVALSNSILCQYIPETYDPLLNILPES